MEQTALECEISLFQRNWEEVRLEIGKVLVGQQGLVERMFIALLANGHLLVEGLPGLAKTLAVTTLAKVIQCHYQRIQFTPDLLPADLLGTTVYNHKEGTFSLHRGPIFTQLLLADEINRAPAKVQSALLEVMQERQVTLGTKSISLEEPFFVLATQNPIEHEGTYPLPEAQIDRFLMKVKVDYPSFSEEKTILARMGNLASLPALEPKITAQEIKKGRRLLSSLYIDEKVIDYILHLVQATRRPERYGLPIQQLLEGGASPRATIALQVCSKAHALLQGHSYVTPHDVRQVATDVLRHRLRLSYEAEAEEVSSEALIEQILQTLPTP